MRGCFFFLLPGIALADCTPTLYVCNNDLSGKEVDNEYESAWTFQDSQGVFFCTPTESEDVTWNMDNVNKVCNKGFRKRFSFDGRAYYGDTGTDVARFYMKKAKYNPLKCMAYDEAQKKCTAYAGENPDFKHAEKNRSPHKPPQFIKGKNINKNIEFLMEYYW